MDEYEKGIIALQEKRYDEALAHFNTIILQVTASATSREAKMKLARAHDLTGQCYAYLGDRTSAEKYYNESIKLNPSSAVTWHHKGLLLLNQFNEHREGDLTEPFVALRRCLDIALLCSPMHPAILHTMAHCYEAYLKKVNYEINDTTATYHQYLNNYYQLALCHSLASDPELYTLIQKDVLAYHNEMGLYFLKMENYDDASVHFSQAATMAITPEEEREVSEHWIDLQKKISRLEEVSPEQKTRQAEHLAQVGFLKAPPTRIKPELAPSTRPHSFPS